MGRLTEEMWQDYLKKTHSDKLTYTLLIYKETIIKLSEQIACNDAEEVKKACEGLCTIFKDLEKKAFIEGIHMMVDRI